MACGHSFTGCCWLPLLLLLLLLGLLGWRQDELIVQESGEERDVCTCDHVEDRRSQ